MREDQSTYAESVKKLGLERGIEGSRATHQTVQHYYESINRGTRSQVSISPEALGRVYCGRAFSPKTWKIRLP